MANKTAESRITVKSLPQMRALAANFAARLTTLHGAKVLFDAPMGAGKTTFISAVIKHLNPSVRVSSPTFAIINKYAENLYHADLYRVNASGTENTGIYDILADKNNWTFVEWAGDLIVPPATENVIKIKINILEGGGREFIIVG